MTFRLFFLLFIFSFSGFSQDQNLEKLKIQAKKFGASGEILKSISLTEKIIAIEAAKKDTSTCIEWYNYLFVLYINIEKREDFVRCEKKLLPLLKYKNEQTSTAFTYLGGTYEYKADFEKANFYYEKAEQFLPKNSPSYHLNIAVLLNNKGTIAMRQGEYTTALKYYQQALYHYSKTDTKNIDTQSEIANTYHNIALTNNRLGNAEISKIYFQKALDLFTPIAKKIDISTTFIAIYTAISVIHLEKTKKLDSAEIFIQKALKMQLEKAKLNQLARSYRQMSKIAIEQRNFVQANIYIDSALVNIERKPLKREKALCLSTKGNILSLMNKNIEALSYFQKAFVELSKDFLSKDFSQNPSAEALIYPVEAQTIMKLKLETLQRAYLQTHQLLYLEAGIATAKDYLQIIDYQRNKYTLEDSKLFLGNKTHEIMGVAIGMAYQLYQVKNDKKYIETAFLFSESNKSIVLYEAIKSAQKLNFNGVPTALLAKEQKLEKDITIFESLIYRDGKKNENLEAQWRAKLLETSDNLKKLKETFKDDYPEYYKFKYDTELISTKEISSQLPNSQAIIEYFIDKNTLFTFLITQKETHFFKQNLPADFKQNILTFKNKIIQKSVSSNYIDLSLGIYNILFLEDINKIIRSNKIENIELILDAELNYIPFESLLVRKPKNLKETQIYLLEHYTIGYLPSATMNWKNTIPKTDKSLSKKYIGFAPKYKKPLDLPNNQANVSFLSKLFSGESFVKTSASKQNFDIQSQNHTKILHLSMHAGASPTDPMESYMAFEKDSLFVHDIYARNIPAELAILDACETGVGILSNGEGVMNLSRAFLHAGCQSVAMSLWKLTSSSETSEIIKDFITLVENGKPKDEALRTAKLNYLNKHRKDLVLSHPFYWSPLILVGKPEAIVETNWIWWFFGGIGLVLMGLFILKKTRHN